MSNDLERSLIQKAAAKGVPIKATLELSPLCNLNCAMCYVRHSAADTERAGGILPVSYWKKRIPEMKAMGILFVTLIGGEPLLYPGIGELYETLAQNGFYVNLTTNGTLLASGIPTWMQKYPPRYVTVSVYGAGEQSYEKITGDPTGYVRMLQGLQHLIEKKISVKLNFIALPENQQDLKAVIALKNQYQLPITATAYCYPKCRTIDPKRYERFLPEECAEQELQIRRLTDPDRYREQKQYLAGDRFRQDTRKHTDRFYCHAGSSSFWITWQGAMIPCGMIRGISVNCRNRSLRKCWEELHARILKQKTSAKCAACSRREVCMVCPAMMEAETGRLDGCPEYLCRMTDAMIIHSR